jgi:hypothetical protein
MASVTIQARDKKLIIWNFMEELCRKYNEATNDGRQPTFHIADFESINLLEQYISRVGNIASNTDSVILDAVLEYEQRGYYKIENDIVNLTENGIAECHKSVHDWD